MLDVSEDSHEKKIQVYIFENRTAWEEFKLNSAERLPGAEAYTSGDEIYIYRDPFFLAPQQTLAHEITHVVVAHFLERIPPLFLNEGLAVFLSYKALALQADGNEYAFHTVRLIEQENFIPLKTLISLKTYPDNPAYFYQEAELFTRYMVYTYGKKNFYRLLKETASGQDFGRALYEVYFTDAETLEEEFKKYALKPKNWL